MAEAFFSFQGWPLTTEIVSLKLNNPSTSNSDKIPVAKSTKSTKKKTVPEPLKTMPPNALSSGTLPKLPAISTPLSNPLVISNPLSNPTKLPSNPTKITLKVIS